MNWFLGIDGGGTRTRALMADAGGLRGGWGESGTGNLLHAGREAVLRHLRGAIGSACLAAGAELGDCVSVFFGMAGVTTEAGRRAWRELGAACGLGHARLGVDHDIRIALAGGLGGRPGVALIVGTGSSCYGRTLDGRTWQTGGWESLIADEGSGYFLGREALVLAARMADGREPVTPLMERVFRWLGVSGIAEVPPKLHEGGMSRADIAAFAPQVLELATAGDRAAAGLMDRGAFLLAEMVAGNHRRLPTGPSPEVVITGGLGSAAGPYREKIEAAIRVQVPTARVVPAVLPPAAGGVLLAMEQAGLRVTEVEIENLRRLATGGRAGVGVNG